MQRGLLPTKTTRLLPSREEQVAHADLHAISEHLCKMLGAVDFVLHETVSEIVHLDVHVSLARPGRDFHVLATSGMSALPMPVPERTCDCPPIAPRIELVLALPPTWPLRGSEARRKKHAWPVGWLRELARYPHRYATFFDVGHTTGTADHEPYIDGTRYAGAILATPRCLPSQFERVDTALGPVRYLMPVPLFDDELEFKHEYGGRALLGCLERLSPSALGTLNLSRMPVF